MNEDRGLRRWEYSLTLGAKVRGTDTFLLSPFYVFYFQYQNSTANIEYATSLKGHGRYEQGYELFADTCYMRSFDSKRAYQATAYSCYFKVNFTITQKFPRGRTTYDASVKRRLPYAGRGMRPRGRFPSPWHSPILAFVDMVTASLHRLYCNKCYSLCPSIAS